MARRKCTWTKLNCLCALAEVFQGHFQKSYVTKINLR